MATPSSAIANLKAQWPNLHDLDRAKAVRAITAAGTSIRKIALQLPVSESSLRRLLKAAQAPLEARLLASNGQLSTNELIRRAKASETRQAVKKSEAQECERVQATLTGCKAICDWLCSERQSVPHCRQIIEEARRSLAMLEEGKQLPKETPVPRIKTAEIIKRCRPAELTDDETNLNDWFARWLVRWVFYSMPDPIVRYRALDMALGKQYKR